VPLVSKMPFETNGWPSEESIVPPIAAHASPHHHPLLAWPIVGGVEGTARALFDALDSDKDGLVSAEDVALSWPRSDTGSMFFDTSDNILTVVRNIAHAGDIDGSRADGNYSSLSWPEFRIAVRLWHISAGNLPTLRSYMLSIAAEYTYGVAIALAAAEATGLVCGASGADANWSQVSTLGGIGAVVATALFDSNSVRPFVRPEKANVHTPSSSGPRTALYTVALASTGALLSPLVPILASTIGDPKTQGYGPLAVAGLAIANFSGQAVTLSVLPQRQLTQKRGVLTSSVVGGLAAVIVGLYAARRAGRDGAEKPIIYASVAISVHSAAVGLRAIRKYELGEPEPLSPALEPLVHLLASFQKLLVLTNIVK